MRRKREDKQPLTTDGYLVMLKCENCIRVGNARLHDSMLIVDIIIFKMTLQFSLLILYHFDLFCFTLLGGLFVCRLEHELDRLRLLFCLSFRCYFLSVLRELYCRRHNVLIPCPPYHGFCFLLTISTYWFFDTDEKSHTNNALT